MLRVRDIEACLGRLGPPRPRLEYYPYDEIGFRATVIGADLDEQQQGHIEWRLQLVDEKGKVVFQDQGTQAPSRPAVDGELPFFAAVPVPPAAPPGKFDFKVDVRDMPSGRQAGFRNRIVIHPSRFVIVGMSFFRDADGTVPASAGGEIGEDVHLRCRVIGFDRSRQRIEVALNLQVVDEKGRPLFDDALEAVVSEDNPDVVRQKEVASFNMKIPLKQDGLHELRITAQDRIGNHVSTCSGPLLVTKP